MAYQRVYGGIIWTNHAIDRLLQRGLSQKLAWEAFKYPDKTSPCKKEETIEYQKRINNSLITIIAKQDEKKTWIVLSAWIDPPLPGSIDAKKFQEYKKYQKASFWGKFFITLKKQLGF